MSPIVFFKPRGSSDTILKLRITTRGSQGDGVPENFAHRRCKLAGKTYPHRLEDRELIRIREMIAPGIRRVKRPRLEADLIACGIPTITLSLPLDIAHRGKGHVKTDDQRAVACCCFQHTPPRLDCHRPIVVEGNLRGWMADRENVMGLLRRPKPRPPVFRFERGTSCGQANVRRPPLQ